FCVRYSDLRGLLRVHGHCQRDVSLAGLRADRELRSSIPCAEPGRLLASVEYLAVQLVSRLRLHSAWRLAQGPPDVGSKRAGNVPAVRVVARRKLELRGVGPVSRAAADCD